MYDIGIAKKITKCREAIKQRETEIKLLEGIQEDVLTGRCRVRDIYPYCRYSFDRFNDRIQYEIHIHETHISYLTRDLKELYKKRSWLDVEYYHPLDVIEIAEKIEHDGFIIGIKL